MFSPWSIALIIGALIALAATHKTPRAWLWIGLGGASFLASAAMWDYGDRAFHPLFAFTCDALFCYAMHLKAKEKWELTILFIFIVSVFINLMKLGGFMPEGEIHAAMLEICNWLALLWMTGVGLIDLAHRYEFNFVHSLHSRLHIARSPST